MTGIVFSSASLPNHLDDRQRFNLWREIYVSRFGAFDFAISENLPFTAMMEISPVGPVAFGRMSGTLERVTRSKGNVATDGRDEYCLLINQGATMGGTHARADFELPSGAAVLMPHNEPGSLFRPATGVHDDWFSVFIPGPLLRASFDNVDDLIARGVPGGSEALLLLTGYSRLLQQHGTIESPELLDVAARTLMDLAVLAIGAEGEKREIALGRGLRAARLQAALSLIGRRFHEVGLSTREVAVSLGISVRYVNDIFQESGIGFTDRILELRLQRARTMLADRSNDSMRIGDIAYAAGFADISHFNRSFRRRFGSTPSGAR